MLHLTTEQRELLAEWSRAEYPREACGVLVGARAGDTVHVHGVVRGRNLEQARPGNRFELDPLTIVSAERDARCNGHEVVGIWHSHPDRSPRPSAADRRGVWAGWSQVIVGVKADGTTSIHTAPA